MPEHCEAMRAQAEGSPDLPERPLHPVHALTTFELRDYRRELEHALTHLPEHAPVRDLLQRRLAEVLGEQEERGRISDGLRS